MRRAEIAPAAVVILFLAAIASGRGVARFIFNSLLCFFRGRGCGGCVHLAADEASDASQPQHQQEAGKATSAQNKFRRGRKHRGHYTYLW
jgi:hypothetical protein